ncbi:ERICH3 isoform 3 [Pan troglodytes]|uniref:ERICH3 isoform 3 n=1 Tax=Pan troglodytes TaxID=9598 RepID=A0A2J8LKQ7_PANTR|nr:ERICH3 isoform 3 [Pan troglodytes]
MLAKGKKAVMKFRNSIGNSQRMNSYQLPNINSYMMPIPPPLPPNGKITRENRSETWRRRRFRPTTAPNGLEPLLTKLSCTCLRNLKRNEKESHKQLVKEVRKKSFSYAGA